MNHWGAWNAAAPTILVEAACLGLWVNLETAIANALTPQASLHMMQSWVSDLMMKSVRCFKFAVRMLVKSRSEFVRIRLIVRIMALVVSSM